MDKEHHIQIEAFTLACEALQSEVEASKAAMSAQEQQHQHVLSIEKAKVRLDVLHITRASVPY